MSATSKPGRERTVSKADGTALGGQTIGYWGSVILNLNNVMGPAIVAFPLTYQDSGWLTTTTVLVLVMVMSSFSATMLCDAMQRIPNNHDFKVGALAIGTRAALAHACVCGRLLVVARAQHARRG